MGASRVTTEKGCRGSCTTPLAGIGMYPATSPKNEPLAAETTSVDPGETFQADRLKVAR